MIDENCYYKLLYKDNKFIVVNLSWFDEFDYDQSALISKKFETKEEAEKVASIANVYPEAAFVFMRTTEE